MALLGSAVLGFIMSITEYYVERRKAMEAKGKDAWQPVNRDREVSFALKAFGKLASSADKGGVRDRSKLEGL